MNQLDEKADIKSVDDEVKLWHKLILEAGKEEDKWRSEVKRVVEIYRGGKNSRDKENVSFNILYSNIETQSEAIYAATPKPDIRRRFKDENKVARNVAEVLERTLSYQIDSFDFDNAFQSAVFDYQTGGRGLVRVRYIPFFETRTVEGSPVFEDAEGNLPEGSMLNEAGQPVEALEEEYIVDEQVSVEYVYWEDFRRGAARRWEDVPWIAFRHTLTRDELKELAPNHAEDVPFKYNTNGEDDKKEENQAFKRAIVWEIWDKDSRKVKFIADGYDSFLKVEEDPLNLQGFWPCPRPIYSTPTTNTLIPVSEYCLYEAQAKELDKVSKRIFALTSALKSRGIYDATFEEISKLQDASDGQLVPVTGFTTLMEKGGLDKAIQYSPIEDIARVLLQLYQNREQIKQVIYEITGLSDIIRGASKASETATAQRIKGQFGSLRLQKKQREVQRFARDVFRLMAEIVSEKFQPETIMQITGREITPEMVDMMKGDLSRGYNIDVETDSTIVTDDTEKQETVRVLLQSTIEFMNGISPFVQSGVIPMEAAKEMLLAAVRQFKGVRGFEDALEQIGAGQGVQQNGGI